MANSFQFVWQVKYLLNKNAPNLIATRFAFKLFGFARNCCLNLNCSKWFFSINLSHEGVNIILTDWTVTLYACVFCSAWIISHLKIAHTLFSMKYFAELVPPDPESWPTLSIVIPACNEEKTIEHAAKSLLQLDYSELEIIMINDRSSDQTGLIIDRVAAGDERVCPVHIEKLPKGWLGKNHALYRGIQLAKGDWVLFTDADVHFEKGTLRKAIAHAINHEADHLAIFPGVQAGSFWLHAVIEAFTLFFVTALRVEQLEKKGTQAYVGSGGFNLIRRAAFDKTPGLEWLKMEVVDDVGLGLMLRNSGAKSLFAMTRAEVTIEWYPTLQMMNRGLEKNIFAGVGRYSVIRMSLAALFPWISIPAPFVAMLWQGGSSWLLWLGIGALVSLFFSALINKFRSKGPFLLTLLVPVSNLILSLIAINSMISCLRRGGILWRGTLYPLAELKAQQRLRPY